MSALFTRPWMLNRTKNFFLLNSMSSDLSRSKRRWTNLLRGLECKKWCIQEQKEFFSFFTLLHIGEKLKAEQSRTTVRLNLMLTRYNVDGWVYLQQSYIVEKEGGTYFCWKTSSRVWSCSSSRHFWSDIHAWNGMNVLILLWSQLEM